MNFRAEDPITLAHGLLTPSKKATSRRIKNREPEAQTVPLSRTRSLSLRRWRGRGRPIVMLHGLLDTAEGWDELARSTTRPVIAFDLPGFGASSLPTRNSIRAYAEDIDKALVKLGVESFTLIGHSMGGAVATSLAERKPNSVHRLILVAPAGYGPLYAADAVAIWPIRKFAAKSLPIFLTNSALVSMVYAIAVSNHKKPSKELVERLRSAHVRSGEGAAAAVDALHKSGHAKNAFYRREVAYSGPVTLIWGDRDQLIPRKHIENVKKSLPQTQERMIPGIGHHPQNECPNKLAEIVGLACK